MMTIDVADARPGLVDALGSGAAKAHLTLAWRPSPPTYKVELVELEEGVSEAFLRYAQTVAAQLAEREKLEYDPEWPLREHEYFQLSKDELPGHNLFSDLADFQNLTTFKKKRLAKPKLYVAAVQTAAGTAFFGRRMAYLKVLNQARGVFSAVWDGSTFNALTDSVATFSTSFDWVFWDGSLYVLDAGGFHAEFRDNAAIMKAVAEHVAAITAKLAIRNAALMTERCQANVAMASKLKRVSQQGLHLTSTPDQLKDYAVQFGIPVVWENDEVIFDGSLEGQWAILKLLDEDRTEGPVSHRHYESAAKRLL